MKNNSEKIDDISLYTTFKFHFSERQLIIGVEAVNNEIEE